MLSAPVTVLLQITHIAGLIVDGAAATCVTVDLEAGYSGRDLADVRLIAERRRNLYFVLPITEVIAERARDVQIRMAARGHHRVAGIIDLNRWVAPRGGLT